MQRTQTKAGLAGAAAACSQASGGHESDQERDEGRGDPSEHNLARSVDGQRELEEDEEEATQHDRTTDACWSQNSHSYRVLPSEPVSNSVGHQSQGASPSPPPGPSRPPPHRYPREHREALAQQGLVLQPSKQAQIVKTNQHMSSMQAGGGAVGGRSAGPKSQYAPSSPIPSRHMSSMLKPGPGIDISPLPPPPTEPVYGNRLLLAAASTSTGHSCEHENLHSSQASYTSCSSSSSSKDRLSAHSASLDGLACSGPCPQGNQSDSSKDGPCGSQGGGNNNNSSSSMRVSSSTSSLASSSSLSDSGKLGPDVRTKTKHGQQSSSASEYKPRPFMGITDKKARFQQQQQQVQHQQQHHSLQSHPSLQAAGRGWFNHSSDGLVCHSMAAMGLQPVDCEAPYAKTGSTYQEPHKPPPPQGATAMSGLQNGTHAKELAEKFCQASNCYKESKPALALQHSFMDGKPKQTGLSRDNPAMHMASMKPKRSFIESNV